MIDLFLERQLPTPVTPELVRQLTREASACLDRHRIQWQGSLLARDGHRLVCHFRARDTESVRLAQRLAGMPLERAWAFRHVRPLPENSTPAR